MAKVQAVVNPALWRYTDSAGVDVGGRTVVFSHDEPAELTTEEYETASTHKVDYLGGEHQLIVKATAKAAAQAEQDAGDKSGDTKAAKAAEGGRDK